MITKSLIFSVVLLLNVACLFASFLRWDPNKENDLAGYKVYFGTRSGQYDQAIDVGKITKWQFNFQPGKYHFAVTAYDHSGNESAFSKEVVFTEFSVTPNPFYKQVKISADCTIEIFNILGEKVKEVKTTGVKYIDLSHLPPGLYFFRCGGRVLKRTKM